MRGKQLTSPKAIRKRILKQRGVELERYTKKPITYDDLPAPYRKTRLMKYVELKFNDKLDNILFQKGTIYDLEKKLGIDATTISKWRKIVSEAKDKEFFKQFP